MCEDCGHSTADPEDHFRHLQENHPFCPALQRCHDKRQFKFKLEQQDGLADDNLSYNYVLQDERNDDDFDESEIKNEIIEGDNRAELDEKSETDLAVAHLQNVTQMNSATCDEPAISPEMKYFNGHYIDPSRNAGNLAETTQSCHPKTIDIPLDCNTHMVINDREKCSVNIYSDIQRQTHSHLRDMQRVRNQPIEQTVAETIPNSKPEIGKRLATSEPTNVSPKKKLKSINSPKKNKTSSPVKHRSPPFGVCENGGNLPRHNLENVVGKSHNEAVVKKRPLGSLTQNTINQHRNTLNMQLAPMNTANIHVTKKPLGNIMENAQW